MGPKYNDSACDEKESSSSSSSSCLDGQLFLEHTTAQGAVLDCEVYPRPDGTVYSCTHCESVQPPLPEDPSAVRNEETESVRVLDGLRELSREYFGEAEVVAKQACYLPGSHDGMPIIGRITGYANAYFGTAHTCWGILNAP